MNMETPKAFHPHKLRFQTIKNPTRRVDRVGNDHVQQMNIGRIICSNKKSRSRYKPTRQKHCPWENERDAVDSPKTTPGRTSAYLPVAVRLLGRIPLPILFSGDSIDTTFDTPGNGGYSWYRCHGRSFHVQTSRQTFGGDDRTTRVAPPAKILRHIRSHGLPGRSIGSIPTVTILSAFMDGTNGPLAARSTSSELSRHVRDSGRVDGTDHGINLCLPADTSTVHLGGGHQSRCWSRGGQGGSGEGEEGRQDRDKSRAVHGGIESKKVFDGCKSCWRDKVCICFEQEEPRMRSVNVFRSDRMSPVYIGERG
jgi:hypothetical protein